MSDEPERLGLIIERVLARFLPPSLPTKVLEHLEGLRGDLATLAINYRVLFTPEEQQRLSNAVDETTAVLVSLKDRRGNARDKTEANVEAAA